MSVRVAAVDPLPVFAKGLAATLADDGHLVETPEDAIEWVRRDGRPVVLLTLLAPSDWTLLMELLRSRPDATVVTFIDEPDLDSHLRALAAGALGVLPRNATPATIREAFQAALRDRVLLPAEVVRALVNRSGVDSSSGETPTEREIGWLRRLRQGCTVAQLAVEAGYSERMMFRLLAALYAKLHAANRTEAIMFAHDEGWI
jgi:DNA-binding NarL/FixJ family response regulator